MQRDKFTCKLCKDTETTLNVHHKYYEQGKEPWEYPMDALVTLCEHCHEVISVKGNEFLKFEDWRIVKSYPIDRQQMILHVMANGLFVIHIYNYVNGKYVYSDSVKYHEASIFKILKTLKK